MEDGKPSLFYQPSSSVPREIAHHDSLAQTFSSQLLHTSTEYNEMVRVAFSLHVNRLWIYLSDIVYLRNRYTQISSATAVYFYQNTLP